MSAPAKVITNGTSPTLAEWNFLLSTTGPDEVTFTAHDCPAVNTYTLGTQVPGYSALRVSETRVRLVPGGLYDIVCRARGLVSGTSRVIARSTKVSTDGWDDLTERRMETKTTTVPQFGDRHPLNPNMFLMSGGDDEMLDIGDGTASWVQRTRNYRGIANGAYKRIVRRITVNENIVSPSDPITVNLPGGWTTAKKSQVSLPRIVVEDTILTTSPPPTTSIPGFFTPINPPPVNLIPISGSNLTYNWPHHWKLASINSTELFLGAGVYHQSLSYEFVWPAQF